MRLFELLMSDETRWTLAIEEQFADGSPVDIWAYRRCQRIENAAPPPFRVFSPGRPVDYCPTPFGAIVVSRRMAEVVGAIAVRDVQRIPAILNEPGEWEVLNIVACEDCIDRSRSIIQYYPANHPERPNAIRGVAKLILNPDAASGHDILLPKGWTVATIVSERMKEAMEQAGITGIRYLPVTE